MFEKFRKWLSGKYTCRQCGKTYHLMTFGYGEAICPNCYKGGRFLFPDKSYWLNHLISVWSWNRKLRKIMSDEA